MHSLYDFPQLVDLVLGRPAGVVATEARSILELLAGRGITGGKVIELACGACPHGILLGKAGFEVAGVDRCPAMLAQAKQRAKTQQVSIYLFQQDILDFHLPCADFDAAIFMFETFPLITEYADLIRHFASVRRHLKTGGVYIIDIDASRQVIREATAEWGRKTSQFPGGWVESWCEDLPGDWVQGVNHTVLHCKVFKDGAIYETRDDWRVRAYSPWQIELLARTLDGWLLDGFYSWQELSDKIATQSHYFTVLVAV